MIDIVDVFESTAAVLKKYNTTKVADMLSYIQIAELQIQYDEDGEVEIPLCALEIASNFLIHPELLTWDDLCYVLNKWRYVSRSYRNLWKNIPGGYSFRTPDIINLREEIAYRFSVLLQYDFTKNSFTTPHPNPTNFCKSTYGLGFTALINGFYIFHYKTHEDMILAMLTI
jgi:hypothetical protein